ncbi:tRNA (adenosine(37)-N6)-dimethylallyltransferase MiaA [bacterium]|nr:tRNA (adenosine(37)-N6)-dimethylallyltransferase MiaA [bacterium]MBT4251473.1 tRNA (adenosine(37)-N6)-dimethylallyltransferase MiaA [bacterium]MBT4597447.1 tRNA (adenosine(37)-N6)-dimethylallyltransferase MiaA [bacterium]MBT6754286.1 tRNA (adenosine(37)-N6)-dimethylallyltransferase MiaA [bacterium]MBT7037612.1 tRNA (adenosine(37)-N6)-dimethylallyltransferase MiaA [bacterium]
MNKLLPKKSKVVVILGPTSSGKSDTAISLAKRFNGEIISADSRQVYRDMDLGTGKVSGSWRLITGEIKQKAFYSEGIPHHLLDFRSPRGDYNVSHFKKDCEKKIKEILSRKKLPIICGGTGFWIDAVVSGVILPEVKPDLNLRKELSLCSPEILTKKLQELDSKRANNIDLKNKVRVIRAIEIATKLGEVPEIKKRQHSDFIFLEIGIDWPQNKLDQKIKERLDGRWQSGMILEIQKLKEFYNLSWEKIQSFGLGYYWIPLFLQKKIDEAELREKVFIAERGYAKRQKTWFRRNKKIVWENEPSKINTLVEKFKK